MKSIMNRKLKIETGWTYLKGTAHMTIGAAAGAAVAVTLQTETAASLFLVGLGLVSGLIPDLDIDGKLSNKITISHTFFRKITQFIGLLLIIYSYFKGLDPEKWYGIGAGTTVIIIASFIKQRTMLTITGIAVLIGGFFLKENWLGLLGIYIIFASFVAHRSYTHSVIGLIFFSIIAFQLEASLKLEGVFTACVLGYISHLVADMKFLPFNKRGVKLFLPFSTKEF